MASNWGPKSNKDPSVAWSFCKCNNKVRGWNLRFYSVGAWFDVCLNFSLVFLQLHTNWQFAQKNRSHRVVGDKKSHPAEWVVAMMVRLLLTTEWWVDGRNRDRGREEYDDVVVLVNYLLFWNVELTRRRLLWFDGAHPHNGILGDIIYASETVSEIFKTNRL